MSVNAMQYDGASDRRVSEVLSQEWLLSLADRQMVQAHPALVYAGDAQGSGTTTIKIAEMGLDGFDPLATIAEGAAVGNTAFTDASYTTTVARQAKQYSQSDLERITDSLGVTSNPQAFVRDAVISAGMRLTTLIANLMGGFANTVGSSGVNLTINNWFEAMALLETGNVMGPYLAIIHSQQYADFRTALRSETGPLQIMQVSSAVQRPRPLNSLDLFGVDAFISNQIPSDGTDRAGGMFGRGAIIWGDATIPADPAANAIFGGKVMVEFGRDQDVGERKITTNYYVGAAEGIDLAGTDITTDA